MLWAQVFSMRQVSSDPPGHLVARLAAMRLAV
jgi:hypothetical protein